MDRSAPLPPRKPSVGGRQIAYCRHCLMPNTRPRIQFDEQAVCNACRNAEDKERIDWEARRTEFLSILEQFRSKTGEWDCIVPWSGGKDSSSIAYKLKFEYGMNPLLITFSPMLPNEVGADNREALIRCGFDHWMVRADQRVHRRLAKRFFIERGNPKVAWDAGVNSAPMQMAVKFGIPLVFYAEHGESEYGGRVLSEESKKLRDFTEVIEHQVGDDPSNWVDEEITPRQLNPYLYPGLGEISQLGVKAYYFAYFSRWSMLENYRYVADKFEFHRHPGGRTCGTFTDFDSLDDKFDNLYYYMQYIKFGFGRAVRDACRMIQNHQMTRAEGLALAQKYDGEFPEEFLDEVVDYLQMSRNELMEVIDRHRNREVWERDGQSWRLRHPLR
jgi:N-acetyl sugar amidotransferase